MSDAPVDVAPTDSSPVIVPAAPVALSDLTPQERQQWRKTGDKPARSDAKAALTDPTPPAESSPAVPADPASATAPSIPSASEPDTSAHKKKSNAESRKAELDAEIQAKLGRRRQLEQEIAEYETRLTQVKPGEAPAAASAPPAPASEEFPEFEDWLGLPGNETKGFGAYTRAVIAAERDRVAVQVSTQQAQQARMQTYTQRMLDATAGDPEWRAQVSPDLLNLLTVDQLPPGQPIRIANVVAQEILESTAPYAVLRHLTDHPEVLREWMQSGSSAEVIRRVTSLSARLTPSTPPPVPTVKTTTDAPTPPPEIGTRTHVLDDDLLVAARSGDFRRYRDAANAADVARLKASGRR